MPFFSIGLTTYKRKDHLKRAIQSLLDQTFPDFEVLVGNDYPAEKLDLRSLGVHDPRVRIINHPDNLGEVGNMNALLNLAAGGYFTWQFDDDLTAPGFLAAAHTAIIEQHSPPCLFTAYEVLHGDASPAVHPAAAAGCRAARRLSGRDFLRGYFQGRCKTMACTALYDVAYLRKIGGMPLLCKAPNALYGEYLLLMQAGLLAHVGYLDEPLVYYRTHQGSWGCGNADLHLFKEAGANLFARGIGLLSQPELVEDFADNFPSLLQLACSGVAGRLHHRHGRLRLRGMLPYLDELRQSLDSLRGMPCQRAARRILQREKLKIIRTALVERTKKALPEGLRTLLSRRRAES